MRCAPGQKRMLNRYGKNTLLHAPDRARRKARNVKMGQKRVCAWLMMNDGLPVTWLERNGRIARWNRDELPNH